LELEEVSAVRRVRDMCADLLLAIGLVWLIPFALIVLLATSRP